jgi:hypothetical protein
MFVSVRDRPQGRRRRSQTYGVNKAARSSKLSLLSAITTGSRNSQGSNDSSSTITQESFSKSSSGSSRRSKSSRTKGKREGRDRKPSVRKSSSEKAVQEKSMSRESVDVFAFLVQADEADDSKPDVNDIPRIEKTPSVKDDSDDESVVRSTHSDSGISMGDSVIHYSNDPLVDTRLPPLLEDVQESTGAPAPRRDEPNHTRRIEWKWPEVPRATHKHPLPGHAARTPSPERIRIHIPPTHAGFDRGYRSPANALSGYDLVADRLASEGLPPVFRSFKKIKFRVLLQLQDEILEMEQQLAALDTTDTQSRLNSDGSISPASRRLSWQWTQSDLPNHRFHILGRLSLKLEQYCTRDSSLLDSARLTTGRSCLVNVPESANAVVITDTSRC